MLVPDEIRKCVVFVGEELKQGGHRLCGTAFFVAVDIEGTDLVASYCVTAKHTLKGIEENSGYKVLLSLNLAEGGRAWVATKISDWLFHPDDELVDVAVCPFNLGGQFDHLVLPWSMALDDKRIREDSIGIGDELFLVGLFNQHSGSARNIPILRVGNIAAMPEEPIISGRWVMDAYLVEARSIGGLSGSPVFVNLGTSRVVKGQIKTAPTPVFYLLGLMHGHWDKPDYDLYGISEDSSTKRERVNMGIAIVVPVQKILEVLNQGLIKNELRRSADEWRIRNSPIADELARNISYSTNDFPPPQSSSTDGPS